MSTSTTWRIDVHRGAGPLRFGMTADEVAVALGVRGEPLHRGDLGDEVTESFEDPGIQVDYDAQGRCVAIQFTGGAAVPVLDGIAAMDVPYPELERQIRNRDPNLVLQRDGFVSMACGVTATVSAIDDEALRAQSVVAFAPGYYDDARDALNALARP